MNSSMTMIFEWAANDDPPSPSLSVEVEPLPTGMEIEVCICMPVCSASFVTVQIAPCPSTAPVQCTATEMGIVQLGCPTNVPLLEVHIQILFDADCMLLKLLLSTHPF